MSIMSGLIETGDDRPVEPDQSLLGEWATRHAWSVVLASSIVFWAALAGLLLWS
jgi:hypothetical protein